MRSSVNSNQIALQNARRHNAYSAIELEKINKRDQLFQCYQI